MYHATAVSSRGGAMASSLSGNDRIGRTHGAIWPPRAFRLQIYPPWVPLSFAGSVSAVPLRPRVNERAIRERKVADTTRFVLV